MEFLCEMVSAFFDALELAVSLFWSFFVSRLGWELGKDMADSIRGVRDKKPTGEKP